jgi:hypothetical protein
MVIKYCEGLKGVARINNKTGDIEVGKRYNSLSEEMQKYIVLQLEILNSVATSYIDADKKALEVLIKLYPNEKKSNLIKQVIKLIASGPNNYFNKMRVINLTKKDE